MRTIRSGEGERDRTHKTNNQPLSARVASVKMKTTPELKKPCHLSITAVSAITNRIFSKLFNI